jgi:hypothetical protein
MSRSTIFGYIAYMLAFLGAAKACYLAGTTPELFGADELFHFDLVSHYSQLETPRSFVGLTLEAGRHINSPIPLVNHESLEPPLYYAIAGAWHAVGQIAVGLNRMPLWDRLLSAAFAFAAVIVGWLVGREIFPGDDFRQLIVPAVIAIIPQRDLCMVSDDSLVPLCAGLALLALLKYAKVPTIGAAICAGLGCSALLMTKTTALPIACIALAAYAWISLKKIDRRSLAVLVGLVPLAAWCAWNLATIGELTGANAKMHQLGFSAKPVSAWGAHALFTAGGAWTFWKELSVSFCRGELSPEGSVIPRFDWAFIGVVSAALVGGCYRVARDRQLGLAVCLSAFVASVAFVAWASVRTDFGVIGMPSLWLQFPGFSNGRLIAGALVPFAVLCASLLPRAVVAHDVQAALAKQ